MIRQFELVETVKGYEPSADEEGLNKAYVYAMKAHGTQKRESGAPYFSHPLEVAGILTLYKVDSATIITALLHDTLEDTTSTLTEMTELFGSEVAALVDGVTKLTRIEFQSDKTKQAENFRKFVLAMSKDIRVLLVKLADRLHNMRTLHFIKDSSKRQRIANETMDIYAPLAERIGMQSMKAELEDLSFSEINPDARNSIIRRLAFLKSREGDLVSRVTSELEKLMLKHDLSVKINGREKTPYSIWRKMQRKSVGFEQLSDTMAFRVIVNSVEECYKVLGIAHRSYSVVPGRFKDYISTQKPNGYQSIHTGVFGPEKQRIELQIRTNTMHVTAEGGLAAHWNYKQGADLKDNKQYRWLRELLDILENASGPEEFLEHTKLEMFQDQVFCFTPRGDLINLPFGATSIDFAYAVHSEVGDSCVGSRINGRMMPLRYQLKNGDQVQIITSEAQTPSPTWDRFVVTGKARTRIRRFVNLQEREEYQKLGRSILLRTFKEKNCELNDKGLSGVLKIFNQHSVPDLCAEVGSGQISARTILETVFPAAKKTPTTKGEKYSTSANLNKADHEAVSITGLTPGMAIHIAECCHPLPGDRIVGIPATGKGVKIHTIDCDVLENFQDSHQEWLDLAWNLQGPPGQHVARIMLSVANSPGALGNLSTSIAKSHGNISNLKINYREHDFFDMIIDIEVKNVTHLTDIIATLRADPEINSVERARGDREVKLH